MVINKIDDFSKGSGLYLNLKKKCELISIHDHSLIDLYGIPVKNEVKYLGVTITKACKTREELNIMSVIKKSKSVLNSWLQRDMSIFSRILITKIEALSRFTYRAFSLPIPNHLMKSINQTNLNFIWKNKHHYLRKGDVVKSLDEGRLKVTDSEAMNGMIKIN